MIRKEGKLEVTGRSYSRAIHTLSEHYSRFTGIPTDIYTANLKDVEKIKNCYESNGRFSEMGHQSHGLYRAAIKAFYRYKLSHPETSNTHKNTNLSKIRTVKKKKKNNNLVHKIVVFLKSFFPRKKTRKAELNSFKGTKKQLFKHLLQHVDLWEKEVHEKYLIANPRCQRCKSMEFPEVTEMHPVDTKKLLKRILNDFPHNKKQSVPTSPLKESFKNMVANGDRLIVLCRTCKKKEETRKMERYPNEMPPIMRKGPSELRY